MDPITNPFTPGSGSRPPELAGREPILGSATFALKRVRASRYAKSQLLLGLHGAGKTALLNRIAEIAEGERYMTSVVAATEGQRLAEMLARPLQRLLLHLSGPENAKVPNRTGHLPTDFANFMVAVGNAAKAADKPVAIFVDEMHHLEAEDLAALIGAAHQISQRALPVMIFGAGLPQLAGLTGDGRAYAERLFDFPAIGPLETRGSEAAVREPVRKAGADITPEALQYIVEQTEGYAYFLQQWGFHGWNVAPKSPIEIGDVKAAAQHVTEALDANFFRARFDRLAPREQVYLRAMAEMGPDPHRPGDVAARLNVDVTIAGPLRMGLTRKGMIYSPGNGVVAFTMPMFDRFLRRAIPKFRPGRKKARS
jgi:hypothetical protein